MAEVQRTQLEWARDAARGYRWALMKADPQRCRELDEQARAAGQHWIAPEYVPPDAAERLVAAVLTPAEIAKASTIPVGTIYSWISRGLLQPVDANESPARYRVLDVVNIQARRKVRRLDTA
ncbi:hypothetical protein [Nocardia sp. NPDC049149]|uniref:hypothetical protein n=1 Tax=Nocardia sp. NPDC049149 TaxID=3364315 RepID=UPI003721FB46